MLQKNRNCKSKKVKKNMIYLRKKGDDENKHKKDFFPPSPSDKKKSIEDK